MIDLNLMLFYFIFESSLLLINFFHISSFLFILCRVEYAKSRVNCPFYLIFYTRVFSLPLLHLFNLLNSYSTF